MLLATVLGGACALLFGRQVFWLFVGVVGFVLGSELAAALFAGAPDLVVLGVAVGAGIVGALLAYALQELMIGVAGFGAGSYVALQVLLHAVPFPGRGSFWLALFVGGLTGMVLFAALFDWAVIVISSLFGADLLVRTLTPDQPTAPVLGLLLALVGIVIQAGALRRWPPPRR